MAQRLRLYDLRLSRFPRVLGFCQDDVTRIAEYANSIQETLLYDKAAGEESWQGTWAEIWFNLSRDQPYITLPREIARLEAVNVCDNPIGLKNQFFEYLEFGNGRMSKNRSDCCRELQAYARNNAVTFTDLSNAPQQIRIYATSDQDIGKRVLVSGYDSNNVQVNSQDVRVIVNGVFLTLTSPFVTSAISFNKITGIQKDVTVGQIEVYQVDPTSGAEVLLLTMEPSEETASYRRYYFDNLPCSCCPVPGATAGTVQISAIAKLEPIAVSVDTDYLLLQSKEAFIEEAMSLRLSEADTPNSQQLAYAHHLKAIRLLIGQVSHYQGIQTPSVGFFPFGSAHLDKVRIGMV